MRTGTQQKTSVPAAGAADAAPWWAAVKKLTEVPVAELVDGFADIGGRQIPYGWLPVRAHSAYAAEFTVWSDLGAETLSTLVGRPYAGESTVRAVVLVARETVLRNRSEPPAAAALPEVITRLIDRFDDYDRGVLSTRKWALRPSSTQETAELLGVAKVNVHRNEQRSYQRLRDLLAEPWHHQITEAAEQVWESLGSLTRESAAAAALTQFGLSLDSEAGQIVLHLAGPYQCAGEWLEVAGTLSAAEGTLHDALDQRGAPTLTQLTPRFAAVGVTAATTVDFTEQQPGLRRFGDQWVRWGAGTGDRAEAALHLAGTPRDLEQIAAVAEVHETNPQRVYLRDVLNGDRRFTRTTRATWGLSQWGLREYAGIYGEIGVCIDAAGGAISTAEVVAEVTGVDVTESSVRAFMSVPGYIIENGIIRRRTASDPWPKVAPAASSRGAFHNGRQLRVALRVDADLLRGSGPPVYAAVATALGVVPGERKMFTATAGHVGLQWRLSSNRGPTFGSLRQVAADVGAEYGDTLVLGFDKADSTVQVTRIAADAQPAQRIAGLLGRRVRDPLAGMARALRCKPEDVVEKLRERGDGEVADQLR